MRPEKRALSRTGVDVAVLWYGDTELPGESGGSAIADAEAGRLRPHDFVAVSIRAGVEQSVGIFERAAM